MKKILSYIGIVIVASLFLIYTYIKIGNVDVLLFGSMFYLIVFLILIFITKIFPILDKSYNRYVYIILSISLWTITFGSIGYKILYQTILVKQSKLSSFTYDIKKQNGKITLSNGKVLNLHKIKNSNLLQTKDKITRCLNKNQNVIVSYKSSNTSFRDKVGINIECLPEKNINILVK